MKHTQNCNLKETPCNDASWTEKVENVETFPLSAFAWLFCYYMHQKQFMFCFASSFSSSRMLVRCFMKRLAEETGLLTQTARHKMAALTVDSNPSLLTSEGCYFQAKPACFTFAGASNIITEQLSHNSLGFIRAVHMHISYICVHERTYLAL